MDEPIKWRELSPRQRDVLIAKKIFGREVHEQNAVMAMEGKEPVVVDRLYFIGLMQVPRYTTDMNAAIDVMRLFTTYVELVWVPGNEFRCKIWPVLESDGPEYGFADNPAEAVCIAALRTMGIEVHR